MRPATVAFAFFALAALAACEDPDPKESRDKLKYLLSDRLRAQGFKVDHTDDDPRARPPTKYKAAIAGLSFTLRHATHSDDTKLQLVTWVYQDEKSFAAAKATGFDEVVADVRKSGTTLHKLLPVETPGHLHLILLAETENTSLTNQLELLFRDFRSNLEKMK
jgi:hypothetical protein